MKDDIEHFYMHELEIKGAENIEIKMVKINKIWNTNSEDLLM